MVEGAFFLSGEVTEDLVPIVEISLINKANKLIPITLTVDTGFNGMICLPRRQKRFCKLQRLGKERFELADGSTVEEEIFAGELIIDNRRLMVEIVFTDSEEGLMGMEMLRGKIAIFDLKNFTITVEE